MQIPKDRSEFIPSIPVDLQTLRLILVLVILAGLLYSYPVLSTPDTVNYDTASTSLSFDYEIESGETEYGTLSLKANTVSTGLGPNEEIRVRMQVGWGNPYNNLENPPTTEVQVAVVIAPSEWSRERAARQGAPLMNNVSTFSLGEYKQFDRDFDIPAGINATGVGPDKATLYYFLQQNPETGPHRLGEITTYNVYRHFWDRPRAYSLLASIGLLGIGIAFLRPSIRKTLQQPINRYADRRWRKKLLDHAERIESEFSEYTSSEGTSQVVVDVRQADRNELSDVADDLDEFYRLHNALTSLDKDSVDSSLYETIWSISAEAFHHGNAVQGWILTDITKEIEDGLEIRCREESFIVDDFVQNLQIRIESGDTEEFEQSVDELSEYQDAKDTIEKWSQLVTTDKGGTRSALAVCVDGNWVEPNRLWSKIESSLSQGDVPAIKRQANEIDKFVSATKSLRTTPARSSGGRVSNVDHPIGKGTAEDALCRKAQAAVQDCDIDTLESILAEADGKATADELNALLQASELAHTSVNPAKIQNKVEQAKSHGNWEQIKSIKKEVEQRVESSWSLSDLLHLTPTQFERIVGELFANRGYSVRVTKQTGDQGVDAIATRGGKTVAIQAKKYDPNGAGKVSGPEVRNAIGATVQKGADVCVVATTSGFSSEAVRAARETKQINVELLTGRDIIAGLAEANVAAPA